MPNKIKNERKEGKEYLPCRIFKFREYRDKLRTFLFQNPNLNFFGVKEFPSQKYGIRVVGTDAGGISPIDMFYSLGDINFFFFRYQDINDSPNQLDERLES